MHDGGGRGGYSRVDVVALCPSNLSPEHESKKKLCVSHFYKNNDSSFSFVQY